MLEWDLLLSRRNTAVIAGMACRPEGDGVDICIEHAAVCGLASSNNNEQLVRLFGAVVLWLAPCWLLAQQQMRFQRLSIEDGLSQATIHDIHQDRRGFMWFGTLDGLNRFDGYTFTVYKPDSDNPQAISNNIVYDMLEDQNSEGMWIATSGGLNYYNPIDDVFTSYRHDPENPDSLPDDLILALTYTKDGHLWLGMGSGMARFHVQSNQFQHYPILPNYPSDIAVRHLMEDSQGTLWAATNHGLAYLRPGARQVRLLRPDNREDSLSGANVWHVLEDRSGDIWAAVSGADGGLNKLSRTGDSFTVYRPNPEDPYAISSSDVRSVFEDSTGTLWIGTLNGLNRLDRGSGRFTKYVNIPADPFSLSHNQVLSLYEDKTGVLWVGTYGGGINRFDRGGVRFLHYKHDPGSLNSLSHNVVMSILEDREGVLWLGVQGGGMNKFDRRTGAFTFYPADINNPDALQSNNVQAIFEDRNGRMWIGTWGGGLSELDRRNDRFTHYRHDPNDPNSLPIDQIWKIHQDRRGRLWLGTTDGGLSLFDPDTALFTNYQHNPNQPNSISNDQIWDIVDDERDGLWLATWGGLNHFNPNTGESKSYRHITGNTSTINGDQTLCIHRDDDGVLWVGATTGLNRFNPDSETFRNYTKKDGLPSDYIYGILEDERGDLWMSTNRGVTRFRPETETFTNYDVNDGLQGDEFNGGAFYRGMSGEMFFGGLNGFNAFFPDAIRDDPHPPQVMITDFQLFKKSVLPRARDAESPLPQTPSTLQSLSLSHEQYVFSFEFAALHYANPARNRYAYMLEGIDKEWVYTDSSLRFATYTKLPADRYTFRVRASNKDGVWNEEGVTVQVTVQPPPWRTWWAYSLYGLALTIALVFFLRAQAGKLEKERALAFKERMVSKRLRQVNKLKDEFLVQTSRELQAPLSAMVDMTDNLRNSGALPNKTQQTLDLVSASGKRLTNMVNDILDFSLIRNDSLELQTSAIDLHTLSDVTLTYCRPLILKKDIKLINAVPKDMPAITADENRLQQILYNLISNAVKYTESGWVKITAELGEDVSITVSDTGHGIEQSRLENLFDFFEMETTGERNTDAVGVGLSLSRRLAELHGGDINVRSVLGEGCHFTVTLPFVPASTQTTSLDQIQEAVSQRFEPLVLAETDILHEPVKKGDFSILVVDDESINRQVLVNHLSLHDYTLFEASGGMEALEIVDNRHVDLVLLDIMMPRMSGFEVCRRLRQKTTVHELPVIFLSARNQVDDLVAGFEAGANDYLTKPISREELLSRVKTHVTLLDNHRNLEHKVAERTAALERQHEQLARTNNKLQEANRILEEVSLTDPLTGLVNRRYLYKYLDRDVAMVRRTYENWLREGTEENRPSNKDLIFMLVDLDRFKNVNDTYGHSAGDRVLIECKELITAASRDEDILARWGGEEFLVVSRNADRDKAESLAERLRRKVEQHDFKINDRETIKITCSIGFACFPFVPQDPAPITWENVLDIADLGLYAAKNSGRNAWVGLHATHKTQADGIVPRLSQDMNSCIDQGDILVTTSRVSAQVLVW